jgi:hypothetical protein
MVQTALMVAAAPVAVEAALVEVTLGMLVVMAEFPQVAVAVAVKHQQVRHQALAVLVRVVKFVFGVLHNESAHY